MSDYSEQEGGGGSSVGDGVKVHSEGSLGESLCSVGGESKLAEKNQFKEDTRVNVSATKEVEEIKKVDITIQKQEGDPKPVLTESTETLKKVDHKENKQTRSYKSQTWEHGTNSETADVILEELNKTDEDKAKPDKHRKHKETPEEQGAAKYKQIDMAAAEKQDHNETAIKQEKPKVTAQVQEKPNETALELKKPKMSIQEQEQSIVTAQVQEKPNVTAQEQEKPKVIAQVQEKPSVTALQLEKPKVTIQEQEKPKITTQIQEKPKVNAQKQEKPKVTAQVQEKPSVTALELEKPKMTTQEQENPKTTAQIQEKPKVNAQEQEKPKVTAQVQEKPSVTALELEKPKMTTPEQEKPKTTAQIQEKPKEQELPKVTGQKQEKTMVTAEQEKTERTFQDQKKAQITFQEQEKSKVAAQVQEKPNVTLLELEKPKTTSQEQEKFIGTTQEQDKPEMTSQEQETKQTAQEVEKPMTSVQEQEKPQATLEQETDTEASKGPKPPKWKTPIQEPQRNPVQNFADLVPPVEKEPETAQGWLELCEKEWGLKRRAIVLPDNANWKDIYKKKPFGRNLLKSPNPEGLSTMQPPPQEVVDPPPERKPLETLGDFSGWQISTEEIPVDRSNVPPGVVVCYLPEYSWCVKEQLLDLCSEGLWPELLDSYQPDIYVLDWYEDSKLHKQVYELHVNLLAEDKKTVLAQLDLTPENDMSGEPTGWNMVSHIFKSYGPGLRYVHFLHKSKDLSVLGFHRTRVADSTLFAQLRG